MRDLAFEACEGLEGKVWELENEVWHRLYDRAIDRAVDNDRDLAVAYADKFICPRVDDLIDCALRTYVILPLYLMDHSGISISTGSFGCPWDSGQVGYIFCDNETIEKDFNGDRELAHGALHGEVAVYDDYLTGNVYGFIVEESDDGDEWKEIDSCWGFFGSDVRTNGMADHLGAELTALANNADIEYPSY
jgi:hypothetical protein